MDTEKTVETVEAVAPAAETAATAPVAAPAATEERPARVPSRQNNANRKRKKVCVFCAEKVSYIDYKDAGKLKKLTSERGKILPEKSDRHLCDASASADHRHQESKSSGSRFLIPPTDFRKRSKNRSAGERGSPAGCFLWFFRMACGQ